MSQERFAIRALLARLPPPPLPPPQLVSPDSGPAMETATTGRKISGTHKLPGLQRLPLELHAQIFRIYGRHRGRPQGDLGYALFPRLPLVISDFIPTLLVPTLWVAPISDRFGEDDTHDHAVIDG